MFLGFDDAGDGPSTVRVPVPEEPPRACDRPRCENRRAPTSPRISWPARRGSGQLGGHDRGMICSCRGRSTSSGRCGRRSRPSCVATRRTPSCGRRWVCCSIRISTCVECWSSGSNAATSHASRWPSTSSSSCELHGRRRAPTGRRCVRWCGCSGIRAAIGRRRGQRTTARIRSPRERGVLGEPRENRCTHALHAR